jgi:hypothetical protein
VGLRSFSVWRSLLARQSTCTRSQVGACTRMQEKRVHAWLRKGTWNPQLKNACQIIV